VSPPQIGELLMLISSAPGGPPIEEARLHRIGVCWHDECRDLFQVIFHKEAIFIEFPYQPDEPGLIARVEVPRGNTHTVELKQTGYGTTHSQKYSHPMDGNAHLSKDGKSVTTVYNQGSRLDLSAGHFFSAFFSGFSFYRRCNNKPPSEQFVFDSADPVDPLYCAGYWLRLDGNVRASSIRNPIVIKPGDGGNNFQALAVAPPRGTRSDGWILAISARRGPDALLAEPGNFRLGFIGGFASNLGNPSEPSSFLAMQYPPGGDISDLHFTDYSRPKPPE
jgi:hypothetical protein